MSTRYSDRPDQGDRGMTMGPGKVAGAGQQMLGGAGPGPAARKKMGMASDMVGTRPAASGKQPSGITKYAEGSRRRGGNRLP
jgi:hypothetical protein